VIFSPPTAFVAAPTLRLRHETSGKTLCRMRPEKAIDAPPDQCKSQIAKELQHFTP
jgi:hypothetical protein